jgi:hypothetical protein
LLRIFCFDLYDHAKGFFDFHLIGFHKSKASFLDFYAKEKGTDFSAPLTIIYIKLFSSKKFPNSFIIPPT